MKNARILTTLVTILFLLMISSCCTKKGCLGHYYKEIIIAFRGFTQNQRSLIRIKEFDKTSGQLLGTNNISYYSAPINDSIARLGFQFNLLDSFYLDQRYFVIESPSQSDTIRNISYQKHNYTINCNNCPGESDPVIDIVNFTFTYKSSTYHENDTIFITP